MFLAPDSESLREYNTCHAPAGSSKGGQFCAKDAFVAAPAATRTVPTPTHPDKDYRGGDFVGKFADGTFNHIKARSKQSIRDIAEALYESPEDFERTSIEHLQRLVKTAEHNIAVPDDVLTKILATGRFQSQHETKTSKGALASKHRTENERTAFGEGYACPEHCPIYGYLSTGDGSSWREHTQAHAYGTLQVELHPRNERTSFMVGDSLGGLSTMVRLPRPVNAVDHLSLPGDGWIRPGRALERATAQHFDVRSRQTLERLASDFYYIEAQYHGGVTVKDIKRVRFKDRPSDYTLRRLQERGIPWEHWSVNDGILDRWPK